MNFKRTILAGVVFLLALLAFQLDSRIITNRRIETVRNESLADGIDKSAVHSIRLKNMQGEGLFVKTEQGWQMVEPVTAPADPESIETLLINVTAAAKRNANEVKNLAQYGLATPEIELELIAPPGEQFSSGQTAFSLHLGFESPYTGQVFAKYPEGDKVFTVGEHVRNTLVRDPLELRYVRLFDINPGDLDKYGGIQIRTGAKRLEVKNELTGWKVASPEEFEAEASVVKDYLTRLGMLRADTFVTERSDSLTSPVAAIQALTSPTVTISIEGPPGVPAETLTMAIINTEPRLWVARRSGTDEIMTLLESTVEEILREPRYFRSRDIFSLSAQEVDLFSIEIGRALPTALIRNADGVWELVGDPEFRINQQAVRDRVAQLVDLQVTDYVDTNPRDLSVYGLDVPRAKFTITGKDQGKTEVLEVGKGEPGKAGMSFGRRNGDPTVFTVQLGGDLYLLAGQIADKNFARTEVDQINRMEVDIEDTTYLLRKVDTDWEIQKPGQDTYARIDVRRVNAFLASLNRMEYERDLSAAGQNVIAAQTGPPLKVRIYGADDEELLDIEVTKKLGESTLVKNARGRTFEARSVDVERVYTAARSMVD